MYRKHKIGLVIPARNEERLIGSTLDGVPELFDRIYVVDDGSWDGQNEVIKGRAVRDPRVVLLQHPVSRGPGAAIITGYQQSSRDNCDIVVVVGGDNQMNLDEVARFLDPIVEGRADYTKGNRFSEGDLERTIAKMPRTRFFANWLISAMTKIFSGNYHVVDVVDGFTAISKRAIDKVNWARAWQKYGYPMDFLIRLNAYDLSVEDIPRTAIYLEGEKQSQINGLKYAVSVFPMLLRSFLWRLNYKYVYRDFHPLVMFFYCSFAFSFLGLLGGTGLIVDKLFFEGDLITGSRSVLIALLVTLGVQLGLFALLFDYQESQSRHRRSSPGRPWLVEDSTEAPVATVPAAPMKKASARAPKMASSRTRRG